MRYKETSNLKVYEQGNYRYKPTPVIMLKGQWREHLDFPAGTPITVKCEAGSGSPDYHQRVRYSKLLGFRRRPFGE